MRHPFQNPKMIGIPQDVSRRRVAGSAAGVRGMDAEPEAYRDVFTASAALPATRRRRIEVCIVLVQECTVKLPGD